MAPGRVYRASKAASFYADRVLRVGLGSRGNSARSFYSWSRRVCGIDSCKSGPGSAIIALSLKPSLLIQMKAASEG